MTPRHPASGANADAAAYGRLLRDSGGEPPALFHVIGVDAAGQSASYPADDYLRNMAAPGCPWITDQAEAIEDARCALVESEGWREVHVYRREPSGAHVRVATLEI